MAEWKPSDWSYLAVYYVPGIIAVNKNSPYKTIQDLVNACVANPDTYTGGTAGIGSSGFVNMEVLKSVIPQFKSYKHIAYSAVGAAAVTATLAGEVDFTPQLSNVMVDIFAHMKPVKGYLIFRPDNQSFYRFDIRIPHIHSYAFYITVSMCF